MEDTTEDTGNDQVDGKPTDEPVEELEPTPTPHPKGKGKQRAINISSSPLPKPISGIR